MNRTARLYTFVLSVALVGTGVGLYDYRAAMIAIGAVLWFDLFASSFRRAP